MTDELDTRWYPLDVRESGNYAAYDALHPGVPAWLQKSLWSWVVRQVANGTPNVSQIERAFRTELPVGRTPFSELQKQAYEDPDFFLKLVDYVAYRQVITFAPSTTQELAEMLDEAGSEWKLDDSSGAYRLARRVPLPVEAAAKKVMSARDKAAQHLAVAWNAVYGYQPDPGKGYGEAIKAMEAATIPVVCPSNPRATLGRVIIDLRAKPDKWMVNLKHPTPDGQVQTVADMLDLVWKGQSDRHGSPDPNAPISVTQEQAEAAVHLAVTVVQWFNTGVVRVR
jgi:hypothetical protein